MEAVPDPVIEPVRIYLWTILQGHAFWMFFIGAGADQTTDDHTGYVSGRYRDGSQSDIWTDVTRCAYATFVSYRPACECGWMGAKYPCNEVGFEACQRAWINDHFIPHVAARLLEQLPDGKQRELTDTDFEWARYSIVY